MNKEPTVLKPIQFLWQMMRPYKGWYLLMLQAPLLTAFYIFANNYSIKLLIDAFSTTNNIEYNQLIYPISVFISAQLILDFVWRVSGYAAWKCEPYVRKKILATAYDYVQYHSYRYFQNTPAGTITSKLRGILDGYDNLFGNIHHSIGKNLCIVVVSIGALLLVNFNIFLFMLVWCIALIAIMMPMALRLNQLSNDVANSKHAMIGYFADNITNIFSLFYFAKRKAELKKTNARMNRDYIPQQITMYKYDFKFSMVACLFYWIMLASTFLFMIYLRKNGLISTGDCIFALLTVLTISFELWTFITAACDFMKQLGDYKSAFSILALPHEDVESEAAKAFVVKQGRIDFKNIVFGYDDTRSIFNNLNLSIEPGEKIGLIGHSGSGKSTLISLLLKNFRPTAGEIYIDDHPLERVTSDSLRNQIALIPQDIMLFHRTIGENIGYANDDATLSDIRAAAKQANIDDYIESLPEKYDTLVGERGIKLSGGQRQRIAIARAILQNAPIIILDEATSSLDSITEQEIQKSINRILEENNSTIIAIAHRLSTIRHMDRIIVMDKGIIIEEGTFDELISNQEGYFKKLWDSQVNGMVI